MTVVLRKIDAAELDFVKRPTPQSTEAKLQALRDYAKAHPEKVTATRVRWEKENPDAARAVWRAHRAVHNAVKRGVLIRPTLCEQCGKPGRRIEAAHHDYAKPLEVSWLCPPCHRLDDKRHPKTAGL